MKKEFDWAEYESKNKNPGKLVFLKENFKTKIDEDEFVFQFSTLDRSQSKNKKQYSPSSARRLYRDLRDNFNFFKD